MKSLIPTSACRLFLQSSCVTILAMTLGSLDAQAAMRKVRTLSDEGRGSLREILSNASDGDVVQIEVAGTILLSRELTLDKDVTIKSSAPGPVVLDANGGGRVFRIPTGDVTLASLILVNGHEPSGGGAILSGGHLWVQSCVFSNNSTLIDGGTGGSILNAGGTLTVLDSHFSGGTASAGGAVASAEGRLTICRSVLNGNWAGSGGALLVEASQLTLMDCTLNSNRTIGSAGAIEFFRPCTCVISRCNFNQNVANASGGVILDDYECVTEIHDSNFIGNQSETSDGGVMQVASIVKITRCTFADNQAPAFAAGGGAIHSSGTLTVESSTFSGNSSAGVGGAIRNLGLAEVKNSTITGNSSFLGGGLNAFDNPGVQQLTIQNTIVAGNISLALDSEYSPDLGGVITSLDYNLIGDAAGSVLAGDLFHSLVGDTANPVNPLLGPLQFNGGWTLTHLPLTGSPVIDAGICGEALTDQRGLPRRVGLTCDIGAVEVQ